MEIKNNLFVFPKKNNNLLPPHNNNINYFNIGNFNEKLTILNNTFISNNPNNINNIIINKDLLNNQQFYSFSNREKNKFNYKNNIYSFNGLGYNNKSSKQKNLYKTPKSKSCERINFNYNNFSKNYNTNNNRNNFDFYDNRVDYCLEMLNLNALKNIFHKKNIEFNEMLYLSQKDMKKMGIPIDSQFVIQKFTQEYLKKADVYTLEELIKFFQLYYNNNIKKKNIQKFTEFSRRSFSPIINYNNNLLNDNIEFDNFNKNNINIINNYKYELNDKNFNYINYDNILINNRFQNTNETNKNNIYVRNCLSASPRKINKKYLQKNNSCNIQDNNHINYQIKNFNNINIKKNNKFTSAYINPVTNFEKNKNVNFYFIDNQHFNNNNKRNLNVLGGKNNMVNVKNINELNQKIKKFYKEKKKRKNEVENINLLNIPMNFDIENKYKNSVERKIQMHNIIIKNPNNKNKQQIQNNLFDSNVNMNNYNINSFLINKNKVNITQKIEKTTKSNSIGQNKKYINKINYHTINSQSQGKNYINNKKNKNINEKERKNNSTSLVSSHVNNQNIIYNINDNENIFKIQMPNNYQNSIRYERNNLNIYYNFNKLIHNNIYNYNTDSSSDNFIKNQLKKEVQIKTKNNNNLIQKQKKIKEVIKKVNSKINCVKHSKKDIPIKKNSIRKQLHQKLLEHNIYPYYISDIKSRRKFLSNYYDNNINDINVNNKSVLINKIYTKNNIEKQMVNQNYNKFQNKRCNSLLNFKNKNNMLNNGNNFRTNGNINKLKEQHRYYSPQQNINNYKSYSCTNTVNYNINSYKNINDINTDGTDDYYINYL